jgi:hypothetical protein
MTDKGASYSLFFFPSGVNPANNKSFNAAGEIKQVEKPSTSKSTKGGNSNH